MSTFKAIIVGGGPTGLAAAHALHLAAIDFVVLERRPAIVEDKGASLIVHAHTFRVLDQFGILDDLLPRGGELSHLSITADGQVFNEGNRYTRLRENHGHAPVTFHRTELIETMYNGLPATAKERVLTNKTLTDITTTDDGVTVTCADGSTLDGSIVIGADGVNSKTRQVMRDIALKESPTRPWDSQKPYTATYQLLYGTFPSPSPVGQGYDIQSKGKVIMYFSGSERKVAGFVHGYNICGASKGEIVDSLFDCIVHSPTVTPLTQETPANRLLRKIGIDVAHVILNIFSQRITRETVEIMEYPEAYSTTEPMPGLLSVLDHTRQATSSPSRF